MMDNKLLVVVLGVLLTSHYCTPDPDPRSNVAEAENNADLPIHRAIRQISFPGQVRPGNRRPVQGGQPAAPVGQCSNCVPIVACAALLEQVSTTCQLPGAGLGVCCPQLPVASVGKGDSRLFTEPRIQVPMKDLSSQDVNSACRQGLTVLDQVRNLENQMINTNQIVEKFTPEYGHLKFFKVTRTARQAHQAALQVNQASREMLSDFGLTRAQGTHGLRQVQVRNSILSGNCPVAPQCNPNAKYRTIDGSCNNLDNPLYGKSETAFQRIVPPVYDDGVSTPRTRSVTGSALPAVRIVASNVLVDRNDEDREFTLSVMQWAQFIDHDLTHAPFSSLSNGEGIECCRNGQEVTGPNRHPECWPIILPQNDPFYAPKGRFCMNFIRSMLGLNQQCTFGYAEQMNQLTHWLDGSNIYGSSATEASRLRSNRSGLLIVSTGNLLPIDEESAGDCMARQRGASCFHAGDSRVNEQPGLTAIHTIFHREHNRVAGILLSMHRSWSDEALFQEARRIVVAEYQHIVFNEWLPIIVGQNFMQSFGLNPLRTGFSFDYNFNINPSINNEFATGAFRFGHSLVQGFIKYVVG
ncbi:hypothetical protein FHG87_000863 [Trinorchestia longiramus]|nr:hypothetical protein FHG87_000863 [Trinorchestia longiramus]